MSKAFEQAGGGTRGGNDFGIDRAAGGRREHQRDAQPAGILRHCR